MSYEAKILADSLSPGGHRLTTFLVTFPRIVLAEVNTHCMLARNSASSRAIPVDRRIAAVEANPFVPEVFGKNRPGMQATEVLNEEEAAGAFLNWNAAKLAALKFAGALSRNGVHKQLANRLLEPFSWHTAIITATDWSNFFNLRDNPDAQGEFQTAARMMRQLYELHEPKPLTEGQWHLPLVTDYDEEDLSEFKGHEKARISTARCARVSYLTHEGKRDIKADLALYERLVTSGHMSPLEHVARPMTEDECDMSESWDIALSEDGPMIRVSTFEFAHSSDRGVPKVGATYRGVNTEYIIRRVRGPHNYCGKFNGWCSLRSMVPGEWDIIGERGR